MRTLSIDPKVFGTACSTTRTIVEKSYCSGTLNRDTSVEAGGGAEASGGALAVAGGLGLHAADANRPPATALVRARRNAEGWGRRRLRGKRRGLHNATRCEPRAR